MIVEIDANEVVAKMMEGEPTPTRQVWEFYIAMKDLHPEFMHQVECVVQFMHSMKSYDKELHDAR